VKKLLYIGKFGLPNMAAGIRVYNLGILFKQLDIETTYICDIPSPIEDKEQIFYKGFNYYFIDSKIEEIKSELAKKNKSLKVISFFEHANFEDIIVAISNIDIFSTNKLIIFKNMDFLNEKTKINKNIIDMFLLELNNIDENTEIIFSQFIEKNDPNFAPSPIFKYIEKKAINFNVKKIDDREVFQFVSKLISSKGGKIDSYVLHEFLSFLPNDLSLINNEIDKLLIENKNITSSMIIDNNLSLSSNIE